MSVRAVLPSPVRSGVSLLLVLLLALTVTVTVPPQAADAARGRAADESAAESYLFNHHNRVRGSRGALQRSSDLDAVARDWADVMASDGSLRHNPHYTTQVKNWSRVAENVGYAGPGDKGDVDQAVALAEWIADGYMNSKSHYDNIMDTHFTQVGVGVSVAKDGTVWNTVLFRTPSATTSPPKAPAPTDPKPAPKPTEPAPTPKPSDPKPAPSETAEQKAARESAEQKARELAAEQQRQRAAEQAQVRSYQQPLADLGWYTGEVDGLAGPATARALRDFQAAVELEVTGEADAATVAALGLKGALTRADHEKAQAELAQERARQAQQLADREARREQIRENTAKAREKLAEQHPRTDFDARRISEHEQRRQPAGVDVRDTDGPFDSAATERTSDAQTTGGLTAWVARTWVRLFGR